MDTYDEYIETTSAGLREARRKKEFNQDELGEKVGVSRQTINAYENGRQEIPTRMVYKLCKALGIRASEFMRIPVPPTSDEVIARATEACGNLANLLLRAANEASTA